MRPRRHKMARPVECRSEDPVLQQIEARRKRAKMTVSELAQAAHISPYSYYHWMDASTSPRLCHLRDIMGVLGMELRVTRIRNSE